MSDQTPDPHDELLRSALTAETEGVTAGPDLLNRIRAPWTTSPWRRRAPWLLAVAAAAVAAGLGATMLGDDGEPQVVDTAEATTTTEPERHPVKGGELVFGIESVATLAPGEAAQASDKLIALGIYDPLTTYVDGRIEPFLAESIEGNEELTQFTITLREGVTFHDGTPLNAEAVVKHFDRLKDPAMPCSCADRVGIIDTMETPEGPEGLTVVFNLRTPSVSFPDLLAGSSGYIESPTAVAGGLDLRADGVGTGPFTLTDYQFGGRVVLEAYPDYWGTDEDGTQLPYLDKLTVVPIPDGGHLSALETEEIDMFQTFDAGVVKQAEDAGFTVERSSQSNSARALLLNNAKPPFDDVRARRALSYALDRDVLNQQVYDGQLVPSYSLFAPDSPFYKPDAQAPHHDPQRARELVDELGGLDFTIVCQPIPEAEDMLDLVEQMGEAVGMHITVEYLGGAEHVQSIFSKGGDYEATCFSTTSTVEPDVIRASLTTGDDGNLTFYSNDEVDRLLDEARWTGEFDERRARYDRVQQILAEEVPMVTTLYDMTAMVYDDSRVGPPPPGEATSPYAIKPGLLYATGP